MALKELDKLNMAYSVYQKEEDSRGTSCEEDMKRIMESTYVHEKTKSELAGEESEIMYECFRQIYTIMEERQLSYVLSFFCMWRYYYVPARREKTMRKSKLMKWKQ